MGEDGASMKAESSHAEEEEHTTNNGGYEGHRMVVLWRRVEIYIHNNGDIGVDNITTINH